MAQERSWRYRQTTTERRVRQSPGCQNGVDVLVEAESTAFDGLERRHGSDRLADRCRLIQRFVCGKRSGLDVCHSPGLCPVNCKVMDYRDAEARHLVVSHH